MDTNFYDVVVCGGETTGLVAAALLARRGLRVLLLGHEPAHAGFDAWGATLSRAPALLPPIDETPVSRVFRELDSVALLKRRASPARGPLRVVLPGGHLDVLSDSVAFERELGRAYGSAGPRVAAAADRLGGVARLLDPLLASAIALPPTASGSGAKWDAWNRCCRAHAPISTPLSTSTTRSGSRAPPWRPPRQRWPPTSSGRWRRPVPSKLPAAERPPSRAVWRDSTTFCWPASKPSVAIDANVSPPCEIVLRRGRAVGVRVLPRDETIGCHHLVWAGSAATLVAALGSNAPPPAKRGGGPLRIAGYRHALSLLCPTPFLPEGTPPRLLAVGDPSRPMTEDNALAITVGVPSTRVPERVPLWLECVVPPHALDGGAGYLRALRARLVHTLGRVLPALEGKLALVASAYDGLPPEGPDAAGVSANKPIPSAAPPPVFGPPAPRPLDVLGLPHATGIKHLYLAGRENLPGLDLEGELTSGWGVAHLVAGGHVRRTTPERRMLLGG